MIFPAGNPRTQWAVVVAPPTPRPLLVEWVCFRLVDAGRKWRVVV